jgi:cysteine-rich repeat protein
MHVHVVSGGGEALSGLNQKLYLQRIIMPENTRLPSIFLAAIFAACYGACALAADAPGSTPEIHPPAGQVCPQGTFVIGFDSESNILCSESCGNGVLDNGEDCDDGNKTNGDGCSATCRSENPTAVQSEEEIAVESPPALPVSTEPVVAQPVVSKIKPSTAVFGTREVTVTIIGTGFTSNTSVLFNGTTYRPSVNQAGTELQVKLATRELAIGRHAITVSNGPGMEMTWKKGLVVF